MKRFEITWKVEVEADSIEDAVEIGRTIRDKTASEHLAFDVREKPVRAAHKIIALDLEVFERCLNGETLMSISNDIGVSTTMIGLRRNRAMWRLAGNEFPEGATDWPRQHKAFWSERIASARAAS